MSYSKNDNKKPVVVVVSGFFNPLHIGHIEMIKQAKKLGDKLVVIVNNDKQVRLKGSVPFMSEKDRLIIIKALGDVDEVFLSIDDYKLANGKVPIIKSLAKIKPDIFANGGDRKNIDDVPEYMVCQELNIKMVDGLGKKIRASSSIIAQAKNHTSSKTKTKIKARAKTKIKVGSKINRKVKSRTGSKIKNIKSLESIKNSRRKFKVTK